MAGLPYGSSAITFHGAWPIPHVALLAVAAVSPIAFSGFARNRWCNGKNARTCTRCVSTRIVDIADSSTCTKNCDITSTITEFFAILYLYLEHNRQWAQRLQLLGGHLVYACRLVGRLRKRRRPHRRQLWKTLFPYDAFVHKHATKASIGCIRFESAIRWLITALSMNGVVRGMRICRLPLCVEARSVIRKRGFAGRFER